MGSSASLAADKNGVPPTLSRFGSIEGMGEAFQPTLNSGTARYGADGVCSREVRTPGCRVQGRVMRFTDSGFDFADINGDQLNDAVRVTPAEVVYCANTGNGTTDLIYADSSADERIRMPDLDEAIGGFAHPHLLTGGRYAGSLTAARNSATCVAVTPKRSSYTATGESGASRRCSRGRGTTPVSWPSSKQKYFARLLTSMRRTAQR